ncbi:MAG: site-2 protease family protein [Armatimonadota bacterium]
MLGKQITLFTIWGFTIRVDLSWVILAFLITWSLATQLYPQFVQHLSTQTYWIMGVVGAVGLFASVVFHELSHSLVARRFGMQMRGITLFIFGGMAEMVEEPKTPLAELLMAIAGPIASVALGIVLFAVTIIGDLLGLPTPVTTVTNVLAATNIMLAIFNLIPGFPLDGGRVLRSLLWMWKHDLLWATRIASQCGSAVAITLIVLGVFKLLEGNGVNAVWWFLLGAFLYSAAQSSYQQTVIRSALAGETVRHFMTHDPITVPPTLTLANLVDEYIYLYHHRMYPVTDGEHLVGCITTDQVKAVPRELWAARTVGEVVGSCALENIAHPDDDAMTALTTMTQTGQSRLIVVEGAQLAGVITLRDLLGFLSLKMELEGGRPGAPVG